MATQPPDYFAAMGGQQNMVDPAAAVARGQMEQLQPQAVQIANQSALQQMAMQRLAVQRQQAFGQGMAQFVANPSSKGLAALYGAFPEFAKQAGDAWSAMEDNRKRTDLTQLGSIASLASKGRYGEAAQILRDRVDADRAAGKDDPADNAVLAMLESGDPQQQKGALGVVTAHLYGAAPEQAQKYLEDAGLSQKPVTVGLDQRLVNPATGEQSVGASPKLENVTNPVTGESTGFNPYTGAYGAAAAPGAPPPSAGASASPSGASAGPPGGDAGFGPAVAHVLSNEGGYSAQDMNGAPVNMGINQAANPGVDVKNLTRDQAVQIYHDKYWVKSGAAQLPANAQAPYFDAYVRNPAIAKQAWAQSGGDPVKFVQLATAKFAGIAARRDGGKYVNAYATRDAGNLAIASGQAPVPGSTGQAAPPGAAGQSDPYHFGSPGLNTKEAPAGYAWNVDRTAVVPIPGGEQDLNAYPPAMIHDAAVELLTTGQMPSMGMGGAAIKKAILDERSRIMQQAGISADQLPAFRARYGADKTALQNISGVESGLHASEGALQPYMAQVLATQKKLQDLQIMDNGPPALNALRLATYSHTGAAATKAAITQYRDAINALQTEYAKFMSSASGMSNTPTTDSARNLAGELTDESLGPAAMQAHMQQLQREASIKMGAVTNQRQALENKLGSYLAPGSGGGIPPSAVSYLQAHPNLRGAFDAKYGKGASARVLAGR